MKRTYFCLKCSAVLNPGTHIILAARNKEKKGLILFSPRPGNYTAILSDDLNIQPNDYVQFACPVCGADADSDADDDLSEIGYSMPDGTRGRVNFSRVFGKHATYFVTNEEIRRYGEHANEYGYVNFFGAGNEEN